MFREKHHYGEFFVGAVVGSTLGAMTALLFTTEEGKKLKKNLVHKFHEMEKNPQFRRVKNKIKQKIKSKVMGKHRRKAKRARR